MGTVAWGQDCLRSPRAGPSARRIPPRASLLCGRCPLYDQTRPDAAVVPARAHTSRPSRRLLPRPGPRSLSHVLDPVHVDADRDMGRAGGDPVNRRGPSARIAPVVDHRVELLQRTRAATRATASATASVIFEMVPADSSTLSVEARWCWISRTSQFHRRIRPGDSHASSPSRRRWPMALPGRGVKVPARSRGTTGLEGPHLGVHRLGCGPVPGVAARLGGRLALFIAQVLAQAKRPGPSPGPP